MTGTATSRPLAFSTAAGILGAGALITTIWNSHRGPLVLVPYAALVVMVALYLRFEQVQGFGRRFAMTLGAFMVATVITSIFVGAVIAKTLFVISAAGYAWRFGIMLAIGAVLSAAVAQLTATAPSEHGAKGASTRSATPPDTASAD